jgi:hypothetical protein
MKRGKEMKKNKKEKEKNILYTRMMALGYDDVTDFARNSKVPLSFETCRRAIYENKQNMRHDYIVALMQHLDFTVPEIKEELLKRGDKCLHKLIDDSKKGVVLNEQETIILKGLRNQPELTPVVLTIISQKDKGKKEAKKEAKKE